MEQTLLVVCVKQCSTVVLGVFLFFFSVKRAAFICHKGSMMHVCQNDDRFRILELKKKQHFKFGRIVCVTSALTRVKKKQIFMD